MDTSTDYYAMLGVDARASTDTIKAAFKKLALRYHPDVYKGADAQERMRLLLLAYQTLSDPEARRRYDAQRSEHIVGRADSGTSSTQRNRAEDMSARRTERETTEHDDRRYYAFPTFDTPSGIVTVKLGDVTYQLDQEQARILKLDGMLRDVETSASQGRVPAVCYCHRCHHSWRATSPDSSSSMTCPACHASDWAEYLLLRCMHCGAVFESEEIHDRLRGNCLYHPYELFPLCPSCRRSRWCPAENARLETLRAAAARRLRMLWGTMIVVAVLLLGVVAFMTLR